MLGDIGGVEVNKYNSEGVKTDEYWRSISPSQDYTDPFVPDDTMLPDDLKIALEIEKRILEYHHTGIEREKSLCHLCHMRMDVIKEKIKALEEKGELKNV